MRLEAQAKGGYYPVHPDAVRHVARKVRPPDGPLCILDPCAGRGEAIATWAEVLGVPPEHVYAIELEDDRADACRQRLPGANVLGPASIFGVGITSRAFPFVWLNPPFDDAIGGGHRVETQFVHHASRWVMPGGVLVICCPQSVAEGYSLQETVMQTFENVSVVPLPQEHRPYNEVVVFCTKRTEWVQTRDVEAWWDEAGSPDVYQIPAALGLPAEFAKIALTDAEVKAALIRSPLRKLLREPPAVQVARPPLELGVGHLALLLASGQLDGLVSPDNEPPHVVRGVCRKVEYLADVEVDDEKDTTKEIYRERIEMIVRTVDVAGRITTLGNLEEKANGA